MNDAQRKPPRLVVGVGASAGGLEAFKQLLGALPDHCGMAFVLVQHLDPRHKSLLAELLAPCTKMRVAEADQSVELEADRVYVIRPDTALAVRDGRIELSMPRIQRGVRLPVDHLFSSLARDCGSRAVGIVLSGAGSDGSAGLRQLKAAGGLTIAQAPDSSGQSGMPQAAIDTGAVDLVLQIPEIPDALQRFAELPEPVRVEPAPPDTTEVGSTLDDADLATLASLLDAHMNFDLRVYKTATIERRVLRRMGLAGFDDLPAYLEQLRGDPREQRTLVRDLLIGVTGFFRDPEAFAALREMFIVPRIAAAPPGSELRVWVPGCATGEEAYSIGIEILDAVAASGKRLSLQMFATDVNQVALSTARGATYPKSIAEHVSRERLGAYFKPGGRDGYEVRPPLRDLVSFAQHDLTKDPPFSRMDLVSCRNVLIYLTPDAQERVLQALHFALAPEGHLLLSTSESLGGQRDLFTTVSKTHRLYKKLGDSRPISLAHAHVRLRGAAATDRARTQGTASPGRSSRPTSSNDLALRTVLEAWVPPTLVVSQADGVLFMHGELGKYLQFPQGENPRFDLGALLRPEIATRARGALYRCRRQGSPVVAISSPGTGDQVRVTANPAPALGDGAVMLTFEDLPTVESPDDEVRAPEDDAEILQLETELRATREDLRNTVEELETSNEELRSSNEESMSMNEELQSANEELEATSEELRSLNEELTTVNQQLREKIEQLEEANDDLNNFLTSTKIATLFLDEELRIKRYTPVAEDTLGIDHRDVGRYIGHAGGALLQDDLEGDARKVLDDLVPQLRELQRSDGAWFQRQVLPYRTESRHIAGVVVTFTDVTKLKSATQRLRLRERQSAVVARLGLLGLQRGDLQPFLEHVVRNTQETLGTDLCEILELQPAGSALLLRAGVGFARGLVGTALSGTGNDSQAGYTLATAEPVIVENLAAETRFSGPPLLVESGVVSGVSCKIGDGDRVYGVLGAHTRSNRSFSREDVDFMQAVANVVGSAIARRQSHLRLAVELAVAQVLADAGSLDEALPHLLQCFVSELDIAVGEAWWPTDDGDELYCRVRHVAPAADRHRVAETFSRDRFAVTEGVVGHAFSSGRAVWCTDLGAADLFLRREAARELGLASGFAIPIRTGSRSMGALAVFSRHRLVSDEPFLRSLEAVGRGIGEFARRTELEQRARHLAAITESSHDAILAYLNDGTITDWLPGAEQLFGFTAQDMVGNSIHRIVPADRQDELRSINARIRQGEVTDAFETKRLRADGEVIDVSVRSSPLRDQHGKVVGIASTDRDIRSRKAAQRALLQADRQKDEFLAMLGHELRNPLAAIRSATELLTLGGADESRLKHVHAVLDRQTRHMGTLLDGLLDVSRIIRGKIQIEKASVDLADLCRDVLSDVQGRLVRRELDIRSDIGPGPIWIRADRVRMAQVIDNLLSNAVKYTHDGGTIALVLGREDTTAVLRVRDTGVGIDPQLLPHIFEVFRQSEQSLDRAEGGLGLGLALVKSLVELHGGTVEARSEGEDQGAEFVVRLPISAAPTKTRPATADGEQCARLKILIIEDNDDVREMLRGLLARKGHQIRVATGGEAGLAQAQDEPPDVVLCDLGLPGGMSGCDVARAIRERGELRTTRLIALSGYGRPEDKQAAAAAGFEAHLTKPIDVQTLERALRQPPRS